MEPVQSHGRRAHRQTFLRAVAAETSGDRIFPLQRVRRTASIDREPLALRTRRRTSVHGRDVVVANSLGV